MKDHSLKFFSLVCLLIFSAGCTSNSWTIDLSTSPTNSQTPVRPIIMYADWTEIQSGVEYKQATITVGAVQEVMHLVRIDQVLNDIRLAVDETTPRTVADWAKQLGAAVLINGSYFDENYRLVTRTVVDGTAAGNLLSGSTGIAQQDSAGLWTIQAWSGQAITTQQAIQSYPVLLQNSAVAFTTGSNSTAQRTVIAIDSDQRIYFIICEYGVLSLAQLSTSLANDLAVSLVTALNLDGGTSTGLVINSSTVQFSDNSLVVSSVLYILPQPGI